MFLMLICILGLIVALAIVLDKVSRLTTRLSRLESDLKEIQRAQMNLASGKEALSNVPTRPSAVRAVDQLAEPGPELGRPSPKPAYRPDPAPTSLAPSLPAAVHESKPPSRSQQEWEQLVGGKLLNRIGALALIIGVGFFLKYAFDNDWISESVRVTFGLGVGFGILALGIRTRAQGFQIFAQGLFGAGIAILYLSIYASFNFYHLLPQGAAFAAMAAVTAIAFFLASRYDALAIAFLGWGGGFLTPFLLSTAEANAAGLFGYLAALNLGVLIALARKRGWDILAPLSLAATAIIFFLWKADQYQAQDLLTAIGFLTVVWGEYTGYQIVCSVRKIPDNAARYSAASLTVIFVFFGLFAVIESRNSLALACAAASAAYLGLYLVVREHPVTETVTKTIHLLATVALAAAAIAIGFESFETIIGWSLEAALLVWCGHYWKRRVVVQAGLLLLGATGFGLLTIARALIYEPIDTFTLLGNERALAFAVFAAALGGSAYLLERSKDVRDELAQLILSTGCAIVVFLLITSETLDYFRHLMVGRTEGIPTQVVAFHRNMILPSIWMLLSVSLLWYALVRRVASVAVVSLCVSVLALVCLVWSGLSYAPIEKYSFLLNIRLAATALMLGATLIQGHLLLTLRDAFTWTPRVLDASRIAAVLLGLFLLTVEGWDIFEKSIATIQHTSGSASVEYDRLRNLQQLTLSGIWLLYSVITMALGLWKRKRAIRKISIGLFGVSILKIFTYDLSFLDTLYRIFSFIGLGVILLAVSYAYQKYKTIIFGDHGTSVP